MVELTFLNLLIYQIKAQIFALNHVISSFAIKSHVPSHQKVSLPKNETRLCESTSEELRGGERLTSRGVHVGVRDVSDGETGHFGGRDGEAGELSGRLGVRGGEGAAGGR